MAKWTNSSCVVLHKFNTLQVVWLQIIRTKNVVCWLICGDAQLSKKYKLKSRIQAVTNVVKHVIRHTQNTIGGSVLNVRKRMQL